MEDWLEKSLGLQIQGRLASSPFFWPVSVPLFWEPHLLPVLDPGLKPQQDVSFSGHLIETNYMDLEKGSGFFNLDLCVFVLGDISCLLEGSERLLSYISMIIIDCP